MTSQLTSGDGGWGDRVGPQEGNWTRDIIAQISVGARLDTGFPHTSESSKVSVPKRC